MIYTSGTTGVPKGVAVTHRNVTQLLESLDAGLDLAPGQVWTQWHSYGLRLSRCGRSWVRCCMVGGWWWCPSRWRARREDFHALLVAEQVSVLSQTPSAVGRCCRRQGLESAGVGGRLVRRCPARWWIGGRRGG